MHFAPSQLELVDKREVKFVCSGGVGWTSSELLEELHLVIHTLCSNEGDYETTNKILEVENSPHVRSLHHGMLSNIANLIETSVFGSVPSIQAALPFIQAQAFCTTAEMDRISRADNIAVSEGCHCTVVSSDIPQYHHTLRKASVISFTIKTKKTALQHSSPNSIPVVG